MSHSPEQNRKKAAAQQESERHARYAQADGSMKAASSKEYFVSPAIQAAGRRVENATAKENTDMGPKDSSPNANIRF